MAGTLIRILFGIPSTRLRVGGIISAEKPMIGYFLKQDDFRCETFSYGSKTDGGSEITRRESLAGKIVNTISVAIVFLTKILIFRPHVVHLNTAFDRNSLLRDVVFAILSAITFRKLVWKIHGSDPECIRTSHWFWRNCGILIIGSAKRIMVLSKTEKTEFIASFGHPEKFVVVRNFLKAEDPVKIKRAVFKREEGAFYGLFVSRIVEQKGVQDILQALPTILQTLPNFRLIVAGDGSYLSSARAMAISTGVNDLVTWLGHIDPENLGSVYESCDIFIFPSRFPEGMPMSLLEAMRHHLPVITTPVRFAGEFMTADVNCLFVMQNDPSSIAGQVIRLARDSELRNRMIMNNLRFLDAFSEDKVGGEYRSVYTSI